jgi:hypothetical protein
MTALESGRDCCYNARGEVTMKATPVLQIFALFVFLTISARGGTVITFDDLSSSAGGTFITNGYQSLDWSNFASLNAVVHDNVNGVSGYGYGRVSASNVALNGSGFPAEIDARGTNFDFLSAYLTGAWNSNLNIQVEGFRNGALVYDLTVIAAATNSTLFTFNYLNIDRLYFNSFGGQSAGFSSSPGENFAMDNFDFEFVPEPSSFLLTTAGALMLWAAVKHKRA